MGRKTFESLPNGKALKERANIVLTQNPTKIEEQENLTIMDNINELEAMAWLGEVMMGAKYYVIGGEKIYKTLLPNCDEILVTKIYNEYDADAFFPNLDEMEEWEIVDDSPIMEESGIKFQYITYGRV